jgi:hypothetical protein
MPRFNRTFSDCHQKHCFFSSEEIWFLFGIHKTNVIIGIESPYIGRLFEEIQISEQNAFGSLINKGIIYLTNQNSIEFSDPAVKAMIETCVKPEHVVWTILSKNECPESTVQHFLYFSGKHIVELAKESDQTYWLTEVQDEKNVEALIRSYWPDQSENNPATTHFSLVETVFDQASTAFAHGDDDTGRELLANAKLNEKANEELSSVLSSESTYIIAINIHNPIDYSRCYTEGLGYLQGKKGSWIIRQTEEDHTKSIHFQPAHLLEFQNQLFAMVK